ncbi:MAG: retroviral-like aspartic protease family protein [Chitinispirillales bacterium]|jgi:predicted aspartyl protease|nr:retroviral-like aspartic protease family protein [Chitinispirillales bacterium]
MPVNIATINGSAMKALPFIVDTGATTTTINKNWLLADLGYTESWIQKNKIIIPESEKPKMANGKRADVYKVPILRINIGGHELQPRDCILSSDTVELSYLLGLDIMRYFKFFFDFDAIDVDAPHGRMFYEFRNSCSEPFTALGEPFAHKLN